MQIIELLTPAYEAAWLPWAVQYFFLIGIAATAALTVAGFALFAKPYSSGDRLMPSGITVLAISAISAPVSLLADLHQPGRFWHFYAYFTPWSWMSIGAYLLPVFILLVLSFCVVWWLGRTVLLRWLAVLLALSAVSILVYTGSEVMAVHARPLWNTIFLPINFVLTGWLGTIGAILLVTRWLPGGLDALPDGLVRRLSLAAVAMLMISALAWCVSGVLGEDSSFRAALRLYDLFPVWRISLFGSVLAGAVMFGLVVRHARFLRRPGYSLLVAVVMMAAGWIFRWIIFMSVQGVPKYGAGLYIYQMPLGGDGLLGMVGVLGLCIALLASAVFLIDRFPGRTMRAASLA